MDYRKEKIQNVVTPKQKKLLANVPKQNQKNGNTKSTEMCDRKLAMPMSGRMSSEQKRLDKFKNKLRESLEGPKTKRDEFTLRQRMVEKLKGARFRYLNEHMYTREGKESMDLFKRDPTAFTAYHEGYRQQVTKWPLNPLDTIIKSIRQMPENCVIADFGCGEARLATAVPQMVHSFDFVAVNGSVTECNMAKVPLQKNSVDIVVCCLSLMGTDLGDYLSEANRVLKPGGLLKIAEVESRFDTVESFVKGVEHFGFKNVWQDLSHNLFYFLDFKKELPTKKKGKLPTISLHPCMYKKR